MNNNVRLPLLLDTLSVYALHPLALWLFQLACANRHLAVMSMPVAILLLVACQTLATIAFLSYVAARDERVSGSVLERINPTQLYKFSVLGVFYAAKLIILYELLYLSQSPLLCAFAAQTANRTADTRVYRETAARLLTFILLSYSIDGNQLVLIYLVGDQCISLASAEYTRIVILGSGMGTLDVLSASFPPAQPSAGVVATTKQNKVVLSLFNHLQVYMFSMLAMALVVMAFHGGDALGWFEKQNEILSSTQYQLLVADAVFLCSAKVLLASSSSSSSSLSHAHTLIVIHVVLIAQLAVQQHTPNALIDTAIVYLGFAGFTVVHWRITANLKKT